MISIIISTYRSEYYKKIIDNIKKTIGEKFEIIPIHNPGIYSIAKAYNLGAQQAKYPYLVFVHEDVLFQTDNWGAILIKEINNDKNIGLIGVVGTKRIARYSLGWYNPFFADQLLSGHINQGINSWENFKYDDFSPNKKGSDNVISLDGVFLFTKKEIWNLNKFDEKIITNFHGYDLDYSLQIIDKGYKVIVNKNILLYHYSFLGKLDKNWLKANKLVLKKWHNILPRRTNDVKINSRLFLKTDMILFFRYLKCEIKFLIK